ncbi:zinc-binding dehydrogenase [Streptomyces zaomyceticus]|uniref:zinc-binding dehydrogenase n=1 Tax=Streptomyces zaomyceticus TaxID=68286 RepID=UPI00167438A2
MGEAARGNGRAVRLARPAAGRPLGELAADGPHVRQRALAGTGEGRRRSAGFIGSGLRDGSLTPVIAEVFDGLERITDAHRLMESDAHLGKIVVRVGRWDEGVQRRGSPSGLPSRSSGGSSRSGVDW